MNYKKRLYEEHIRELARHFKIIFLVGARQVGKSTLLEHLFPDYRSFVFDPLQDLYNVRQDPDLFLQNFPAPLILDEIQFVPEVLPSLKRMVDRSDARGQYFLTGSQQLSILRSVAESLAGRVAIIDIGPMIPQEQYSNYSTSDNWLAVYLAHPETVHTRCSGGSVQQSLYEILWRGGMPGAIELPHQTLPTYFSSYIQTYVERDIRTLENIQNLSDFGRFFALLAALTAQEINYSELGREIGITPATAQRWVQLLMHTYQWFEVPAYHGNVIKRISSKPKGFFSDTGIASYLQRISSPQALASSPLLGALFESFCFSLIRTLASVLPMKPRMYHWRTGGGAEVDLILELDGTLYPIEIKCKSNVTGHDTRGIQAFKQTYPHQKIAMGLILYAGDVCYQVNDHAVALPWNSVILKNGGN